MHYIKSTCRDLTLFWDICSLTMNTMPAFYYCQHFFFYWCMLAKLEDKMKRCCWCTVLMCGKKVSSSWFESQPFHYIPDDIKHTTKITDNDKHIRLAVQQPTHLRSHTVVTRQDMDAPHRQTFQSCKIKNTKTKNVIKE